MQGAGVEEALYSSVLCATVSICRGPCMMPLAVPAGFMFLYGDSEKLIDHLQDVIHITKPRA